MIKEFKEIEMLVCNENNEVVDTTRNFKTGLVSAKKYKSKQLIFQWGAKMRLDDDVFVQRLKKVVPMLLNREIDTLVFTQGTHSVTVTNANGEALIS